MAASVALAASLTCTKEKTPAPEPPDVGRDRAVGRKGSPGPVEEAVAQEGAAHSRAAQRLLLKPGQRGHRLGERAGRRMVERITLPPEAAAIGSVSECHALRDHLP